MLTLVPIGNGGIAEHVVVKADQTVAKPEDLSFQAGVEATGARFVASGPRVRRSRPRTSPARGRPGGRPGWR